MNQPKKPWHLRLGQTLEQASHDVFDVFRWMVSVGVARYVAIKSESVLFEWVAYGLSAVLFMFLMAIFLLRGHFTLIQSDAKWAVVTNMMANLTVCVLAFAASIWLVTLMVDAFILYQDR